MSLTKVTLTGTVDTIKAGWTKFNDLIDDLLSTDSGLGASCIGLEDSADNVAATNVEAAIAEIYTDTSSVRTLGDVFDEDSYTTTGLTWGYKAGTVRFDNTITTVAAGTVSLTDDATNYIEVNSSGTVSRNTTAFTSGRIPIRTVVTSAGVQTTSTDGRSWFQSWDVPLPVAKGGTGAATLTDGGILLGSGMGAITALGVATNGQIPIGDGTTDPVLATITGTSNQITITNAAGSITISIPDTAVITFGNTGLHILDTNASHDLIIKPGSDLTADKTLTITTGDADRTITLSENLTVEAASTVNQDLSSDADVQFGSVTVGNSGLHVADTNASHDLIIKPGSDLSADRILTITTGDTARTITLSGDTTLSGTNTGDYTHPNHTGDVTSSGDGATTIGAGKVIPSKFPAPTAGDYYLTGCSIASSTSGIYELVATFYFPVAGTVRARIGVASGDGATTVYGRVYKNGVAAGTEKSTATSTYVFQSDDIAVAASDTLELMLKQGGASSALGYMVIGVGTIMLPAAVNIVDV
jgi:hypothetical protein